jgi:hypothetical protein
MSRIGRRIVYVIFGNRGAADHLADIHTALRGATRALVRPVTASGDHPVTGIRGMSARPKRERFSHPRRAVARARRQAQGIDNLPTCPGDALMWACPPSPAVAARMIPTARRG